MKRHPRELKVREFQRKLDEAFLDVLREQSDDELTVAEQVQAINNAAHSMIASTVKYQISFERHGNFETPGGQAPSETEPE